MRPMKKRSVIPWFLCYPGTPIVTVTEWVDPTLVNINHPTSCDHRKLQEMKRKPWADVSPKAVTHTTVSLETVCESCILIAPQYEGEGEPNSLSL